MKTIVLDGDLGERFGRTWNLDVRTPAEAMRAIEANRNGFFAHMIASGDKGVGYSVLLDTESLGEEGLRAPFSNETLRIVPVVTGSKQGVGQVLLGLVLYVVSYFYPPAAPYLVPVASALVWGGVAQMLTRHPQPADAQASSALSSYYFSGPQNTTGQGVGVPVGYGEAVVGSVVVSAGITSDNLQVYT